MTKEGGTNKSRKKDFYLTSWRKGALLSFRVQLDRRGVCESSKEQKYTLNRICVVANWLIVIWQIIDALDSRERQRYSPCVTVRLLFQLRCLDFSLLKSTFLAACQAKKNSKNLKYFSSLASPTNQQFVVWMGISERGVHVSLLQAWMYLKNEFMTRTQNCGCAIRVTRQENLDLLQKQETDPRVSISVWVFKMYMNRNISTIS